VGNDDGVQFPLSGDRRSTTATGREAFAAAAAVVDHELARRIRGTRDWRKEYIVPARDLVAVGGVSSAAAVSASQAGLDHLEQEFVIVRDGVEHQLYGPDGPGLRDLAGPGFETRTFEGSGDRRGVFVPYHGHDLEGSDLRRQVYRWVDHGVAEPSLADAVDAAIDNPGWFDLSDQQVVLLGAAAELGPLRQLLGWGARVVAVDLARPRNWERIIAAVADTPGVLHVPVPAGVGPEADVTDVAGADILGQLPEIAAWLDEFPGPVVLGNYLYGDGAVNVRLSVAADALGGDLISRRDRSDGASNVTLAFLATPTDAFQVSDDVVADSRRRWSKARLARAARLPLRWPNLFQPNYPEVLTAADGSTFGIADCLVPQQGPNYLLAKRMQRWRAIVARDQGIRVSLNVAPATRTESVVKNKLLAAAYAGAGRFGMEIFEPETCNALMALLLVRDLRDPASAANPGVPLAHPSVLFSEAANHGGLWRSAYSPRSVLGVAAVVGMIERAA
jgi:hypothetical protein